MQNTKVVYEPQLVARDPNKQYPNGWGFTPQLVALIESLGDQTEAYVLQHFKKQYEGAEFECVAVIPREVEFVLPLPIETLETTEELAPPLTAEDLATEYTGTADLLYGHYVNEAHKKDLPVEETLTKEKFMQILEDDGKVIELGNKYTVN